MKNLLFFVSLLAASLTVNAATFQGTTTGTFENPTGPSNMAVTGVGTDEFSWGIGSTKYIFWVIPFGQHDPSELGYAGDTFNTDVNNQFVVGNLDFYNGIINSGTQANSVDLSLTLNFTSPSVFSQNFVYDFSLDNVVNPEGDTVTLMTSAPTQFYSYEGVDYYFELLGFSQNGDLLDSIFLDEGASTTAQLIGKFTAMPSEVPLPAAVWLFGSGLMGFMAMRRRTRAQHA